MCQADYGELAGDADFGGKNSCDHADGGISFEQRTAGSRGAQAEQFCEPLPPLSVVAYKINCESTCIPIGGPLPYERLFCGQRRTQRKRTRL